MGDEEAETDNAPADHATDLYSREHLAAGSYGLSEISGRPIPRERLDALPAAMTLVDEADAARGGV